MDETSGHPQSLTARGAAELRIDADTLEALRELTPVLAEEVVAAITENVPGYAGALSGRMGTIIRNAVQNALGVFLDLIELTERGSELPAQVPGSEAAYELGRGEARNGRTMDALLAAYRVGARVSWRGLSATLVSARMPADTVARFAEVVFAFIDELSATSAAGHAEELATKGRARERYRARLARALLEGGTAELLDAYAERADWEPPEILTAVLLPAARARMYLLPLDPRTLLLSEDAPGLPEDDAVLLVPGARELDRAVLLRRLPESGAVVGPARPWQRVRASYLRALRTRELTATDGKSVVDSEDHLVELVVNADAEALRDLRERVLAPLASMRPGVADRLRETLRSWLLHQGRRDEVAAELFVHPQTVRYRMGQLRDLFGDALQDPERVLELTLALALPPVLPPEE